MPSQTKLEHLIDQATVTLSGLDQSSAEMLIDGLKRAKDAVTDALDEALALAVLSGESIRTVAGYAEIAPNSVPPRLAKTSSLAEYAEPDGSRVTAQGIARARHDAPLTFVPRR